MSRRSVCGSESNFPGKSPRQWGPGTQVLSLQLSRTGQKL